MYIFGAKQVGPISHLTASVPRLVSIIYYSKIATSSPDMRTGADSQKPYVSFSRNLTSAATRNNKKWRYGIIVDGDKLSNRYQLKPYNYTAVKNEAGVGVDVKGIRAYDNDTYTLTPWIGNTTRIPKWLYDEIKLAIMNMPQQYNSKNGLAVETDKAKRKTNGAYRTEWIYYKSQYHGMPMTPENLSDRALTWISNHVLNEEETRILMPKQKVKDNKAERAARESVTDADGYITDITGLSCIDLKGCIIGLVLPRDEVKYFNDPPNKHWSLLKEVVEEVLPKNFRIETY